jgi:hypothetical protein
MRPARSLQGSVCTLVSTILVFFSLRKRSAVTRCYAALDYFDFALIQKPCGKPMFLESDRDSSFTLIRYSTLYRVSPGTIGDAAHGICRQAGEHPRFKKRKVLRRHCCGLWADVWPDEDCRPVVVESANVRCTVISRVSTACNPAFVHRSRMASIREAPELGGSGTVIPSERISACNAS